MAFTISEQGELEDTGENERGRKSSPHFMAIFFFFQLHNVKCHRDNVQSRLVFSPFKPNGKPKMDVMLNLDHLQKRLAINSLLKKNTGPRVWA